MKIKRTISALLAMSMIISSANFSYAQSDDSFAGTASDAVVSGTAIDKESADVSVYSLLPLDEYRVNVDLRDYLPVELANVKINDILARIEEQGYEFTNGKTTVWENYVDEEGNEVSDVWEKHSPEDSINLSQRDLGYCRQELIVGSGNQLDPNNIRFLVDIDYLNGDNTFDYSITELNDPEKKNIANEVYLGTAEVYLDDYTDEYELVPYIEFYTDAKYSENAEYTLKLNLKEAFSDTKMRIFKGKYATAEEAVASGNEITEQITSENGLNDHWLLDKNLALENLDYLTFVYERNGEVSGVESRAIIVYRQNSLEII